MIKSIYVNNFVLIESLSLDFTNAYSCFTGETGAGKSLLIDAIGILCGNRVSTSYIKKGAQKALIEAVIEIDDTTHPSYQLLVENGYLLEDQCFIISRELNIDGKSTTRINQRTTTLSFSKELLSHLIDIHSQHDNQYLLNTKYHLSLLDSFIKETSLHDEVSDLYHKYQIKVKQLDQFLQEEANPDDLSYYQFQLNEMQQLNITKDELEMLEVRQKELSNFDKISSQLTQATQQLEQSHYANIYDAAKAIQDAQIPSLQTNQEELLNAYYCVDEQLSTIKEYVSNLSYDEQEYDQLQSRVFAIQNAFRKHGNTYEKFVLKMQDYESRIAAIENREAMVITLEEEKVLCYNQFLEKAKLLSNKRKKGALVLEEKIKNELLDLHLANAQCKIAFDEQVGIHGMDKVELMISMNKGVALQPLAKVASGGELSRLMLGLKNIFNHLQNIKVVIFDEIDNGVSGQVAYAIGRKMHSLGQDAQIFSVTHLAPVAAWANAHYLVSKNQDEFETTTRISLLDKEDSIVELANIAHGNISENTLSAAKELYDSCLK